MVASGQDNSVERRPWILVDTPGTLGMSGSPAYNRTFLASEARDPRGNGGSSRSTDRVKLELAGVYAGALGNKDIERLRLGGSNPFGRPISL
jgi:hypothetical protein